MGILCPALIQRHTTRYFAVLHPKRWDEVIVWNGSICVDWEENTPRGWVRHIRVILEEHIVHKKCGAAWIGTLVGDPAKAADQLFQILATEVNRVLLPVTSQRNETRGNSRSQ